MKTKIGYFASPNKDTLIELKQYITAENMDFYFIKVDDAHIFQARVRIG